MKSKLLILSGLLLVIASTSGCSLLKSNQERVKNNAASEKLSIPPTLNPPAPHTNTQTPAIATKPVTTRPQVTKAVMVEPAYQANKQYFIVVGTYPTQNQALDTFARLSSIGLTNTAMETRKTNQGQTLHMVRLGPFTDQSEINETKNALTSDGLSQFKVVEN